MRPTRTRQNRACTGCGATAGSSTGAADGALEPTAHGEFVQPDDSNLLYLGRDRHFEPLTAAFLEDPLFERTVKLVGRIAPVLDDAPEWTVWVHPFRVVASADNEGRPTPEGVHRDGVTLVGSLLIGVDNAVGGAKARCSARTANDS